MIDRELIKSKTADIVGYYRELEAILAEDTNSILNDNLKVHSIERLFQLIVDATIDVNTHIIGESGFSAPDDYQSTFMVLAENKVLPMDFALRIAPSVGLRNLIVHKYGNVDLKRMVDDIRANISQYREYIALLDAFLKK